MALTGGYLIVIRGDVIIDRYGDTAVLLGDEHHGETLRGAVSFIDPPTPQPGRRKGRERS